MTYLHVKMFIFCASSMQLVLMGTVKSNNCKTGLLEAASRLILWENCTSNPTTNLWWKREILLKREIVFTPIKFVKKSYWSKGHHCTFIQRVARSEKQFSQRKQTLRSCWQVITYQVKPFLNNVSFCESFCSFKVGCFTAIKNASRFFFYGYSEVLTLKKWVKRDAWLVLNLYLDFHAYSNK